MGSSSSPSSNPIDRCEHESGCKEPAAFEYVGEAPPEKPRYTFQKYRTRLKLCLDHVAPVMRYVLGYVTVGTDTTAYFRRLDSDVLRFRCNSCGRALKYEYVNEPSSVKGPPRFCPSCGVEGECAKYDSDQDYWELLGKALGDMDPTLTKMLYDEWLSRPSKYSRFRDYVTAQVDSADELDLEA